MDAKSFVCILLFRHSILLRYHIFIQPNYQRSQSLGALSNVSVISVIRLSNLFTQRPLASSVFRLNRMLHEMAGMMSMSIRPTLWHVT